MITEKEAKKKIKKYLVIMVWLTVLTALEVGVVYVPMSYLLIATVLTLMACVKAAIVGWYYMHLNHESRWLQWASLSPLIVLIYVVALGFEAPTRKNSPYWSAPKRKVLKKKDTSSVAPIEKIIVVDKK